MGVSKINFLVCGGLENAFFVCGVLENAFLLCIWGSRKFCFLGVGSRKCHFLYVEVSLFRNQTESITQSFHSYFLLKVAATSQPIMLKIGFHLRY